MGVLVAREYETEVVEPMLEHDTQDRNAKLTRIGEVRQTKMAGRVPGGKSPPAQAPQVLAMRACVAPACVECWRISRDGGGGLLPAPQWLGCRVPPSGSTRSPRPKASPMGQVAD